MEKENIFFVGGEEKRRSKRKTIFGEGKYTFVAGKKNREGKGGKFIFWRRKTEKEKVENVWRKKLMVTPTNRPTGRLYCNLPLYEF